METQQAYKMIWVELLLVLILPMRNGNSNLLDKYEANLQRSYPTYEEWKQYIRQKVETIEKTFLSYL